MTDGFVFDDGGREAAGFKGEAGDCVTRAIAIATGLPYAEVYGLVNEVAVRERGRVRRGRVQRSSARTGVFKPTIRRVMERLGWRWVPTMQIGQGCKVHLCAEELPAGRLVVSVSRHLTAVIDGVIHDTHDPRRAGGWIVGMRDGVEFKDKVGGRCVYGYFVQGD